MDSIGRELDLYSTEQTESPAPPPAAPAAPRAATPLELDLYEGIAPEEKLAAKLKERPREGETDTGPRPASSIDSAKAGAEPEEKPPEWFATLWGCFPAVIRDRYRAAGIIGEGGMGLVIEAFDLHMDRTVAIKGLRDPAGLTSQQRSRQAEEARITARLPHPNIMPVYDLWRDAQGNPWCSMMRVPGENPTLARQLNELADRVRIEDRPLSKLLGSYAEVCRAVAHAHRNGVIHRDLKPDNIFMGPAGEALVADWGVALDLRAAPNTAAALVGTPGYAAPEQLGAFGKPWSDARSDIYSLGVILFELVVARRFTQAPTADSNKIVRLDSAPRNVAVPERVPRELASIIRKATSWEPSERHASVEALILELDTYQMGGLLEGIEYNPIERVSKWADANPGRAAAAAVAFAVALFVVANMAYVQHRNRLEAAQQAELLREQAVALAEARHQQAQLYAQKAAAASLARSPDRALHYAALALDKCPPGRVLPTATAYSIAAGSRALGRLLWTQKMDSVMNSVAFHPDARRLAFAGLDGMVRVVDVATGEAVAQLSGHQGWVECVAFDPAGETLASAGQDGVVRLWDVATWKPRASLSGHKGPIQNLVYCGPDGKRLVTSGEDGTIRLWDVAKGAEIWRRDQAVSGPRALAAHPLGTHLAVGASNGSLPFWGVEPGEVQSLVADIKSPPSQLAFSPDGKMLAWTGSRGEEDYGVTLLDLLSWVPIGVLEGHTADVTAIAFSPNGTRLASAGDDMTIRVWPLDTRKLCLILNGHTDAITGLAFSPDGRTLASVGQDKTVRIWDVDASQSVENSQMLSGTPKFLVFSPDGLTLAGGDSERRVHVWDVASRRELLRTPEEHADLQAITFARDGRELVFRTSSGDTIRWDVDGRRQAGRTTGAPTRFCSLSHGANGQLLACSTRLDTLELADVMGGKTVLSIPEGMADAMTIAVSPDGKTVAIGDKDRGVSLRESPSGREVGRLSSEVDGLDQLEFSPDGRWLLRGGGARVLERWDLSKPERPIGMLVGHVSRVLSYAFSPDGTRLASGSKDGEVLLWDVERCRVLARLKASERGIVSLAFGPDGRMLASTSWDSWLRLWDVGRLDDPKGLLATVQDSSPFAKFDVERLVDGRSSPGRARFPADHPFHWLEAAQSGDACARLRAGLTMLSCWRESEDLPRGWGHAAQELLAPKADKR